MNEHDQPSPSPRGLPTEELSGLRLLLRDDLTFTLQQFAGETCYVIEDPVHSAYYRIGCSEYTFLSLLNGRNTVNEAIAKSAVALGANALSEQEVSTVCRWLTDNHLAGTQQSRHSQRFTEIQTKAEAGRWKKLLNPLTFSLNLGNPSSLLHRLLPLLGWLYSRFGWVVWICILCLGGIRLLIDWRSVAHDSVPVVAPENWLWLGLVWLGLKLIHEVSHGLCCLSHGGSVRVCGINTVMFFPMPFVDTSSSWRLPSKWQRMHVAFAGIYAELLIAALAAFVRSYSTQEVLRMLCLQVMLTGGVLTLLFNMNPLSRFDGYYMLTDWLEIPNLAQVARRSILQFMKRVLFGVRFVKSEDSFRRTAFLATYGSLAAIWRLLVTASMIFAAEKLFHGAGLPLALLAATLWIVVPLLQGLSYLIFGNLAERPSRLRCITIASLLLCVMYFGGRSVLWPEELVLPAVVDYVPAETVRCAVSGFVTNVDVTPGQNVKAGDVLLTLSNPEVDFEIANLEVQIARSQLRRQHFQTTGDIASRQTEDATLASMQTKLAEKRQSQRDLIVRAPSAGIVIAEDLSNLPGQFMSSGDSICLIGNASEKNVRIVVSQENVEPILDHVGQIISVRFRGAAGESVSGILREVEPRASTQLVHPALAAAVGGPLAVRATQTGESNQRGTWELTQPSFVGTVEISDDTRSRCGAGQLATVHVHVARRTVAQRVVSAVDSWIGSKRASQN